MLQKHKFEKFKIKILFSIQICDALSLIISFPPPRSENTRVAPLISTLSFSLFLLFLYLSVFLFLLFLYLSFFFFYFFLISFLAPFTFLLLAPPIYFLFLLFSFPYSLLYFLFFLFIFLFVSKIFSIICYFC